MAAARFDADVAVIGLGAMGAHAAWRLAVRGVRVIGVEQFEPGHDRGSSHGLTRLFRVACLEHPTLVEVARRSRALWRELRAYSDGPILDTTGGVMIGPADSAVVTGTLAAAAAHGLPVERLTRAQVAERFPQHRNLGADVVGVWDPEAGVAYPETAVVAAVAAARAAGAEIRTGTRVASVDPVDGGVVIRTASGDLTVRQAVVASGAWLGGHVPGLDLAPIRTPMTWFEPVDPADGSFGLADFPVFVRALDRDNGVWGHGAVDANGVKVGPIHDPGFTAVDPDRVDRRITPDDHALVSAFVGRALPGLAPTPARAITCMTTRTRDDQFVIGRPGGDPRLVIGGGGGGHAFKHAAGIGELLAQIVTAEPTFVDTAFVAPDRFGPAAGGRR